MAGRGRELLEALKPIGKFSHFDQAHGTGANRLFEHVHNRRSNQTPEHGSQRCAIGVGFSDWLPE